MCDPLLGVIMVQRSIGLINNREKNVTTELSLPMTPRGSVNKTMNNKATSSLVRVEITVPDRTSPPPHPPSPPPKKKKKKRKKENNNTLSSTKLEERPTASHYKALRITNNTDLSFLTLSSQIVMIQGNKAFILQSSMHLQKLAIGSFIPLSQFIIFV